MSQASFLESVVTWDEVQCQQNLDQALPKLIAHLQASEVLQEEIGVLKIICLSFLPCVSFQEAERQLFSQITDKCCTVLNQLLLSIDDIPKQSEALGEIQNLLQLLVELLDCYTTCIKYVQESGETIAVENIHSLPYGTVHLLKGTYIHCKDSAEVYGDVLANLTEPLSAVFKKAHTLQVALLGLLDSITMDRAATQQDVDDLCFICHGLYEVCQVVYSLDMKLVCSLWKTISRFCSRHKSLVGPDLDVDNIINYLCGEINNGYTCLYQLAPSPSPSHELSLSQGDSAAFQKSVKVLGYQMRILVSLLDSFVDHISQCEMTVFKLLIAIYRNLPPCLSAPKISETHIDEIQRQIVNGTEPMISMLAENPRFIECVTASNQVLQDEDWIAYLLLCIKVMDFLPKLAGDVQDKWLSPTLYEGDAQRDSILQCTFQATDKCYVEMTLPVTLAGVECGGRPAPQVSLCQHICTHVCALVASLPAKHLGVLENCLFKNVCSPNLTLAILAADVWCFMARFGSADLCYNHVRLLIDLVLKSDVSCSSLSCIHRLIRRLVKFLAPEHQTALLQTYPPSSHVQVWQHIPLSVLSPHLRTEVMGVIITDCVTRIQGFMQNTQRSYKDLVTLFKALKLLASVTVHLQITVEALPDPLQSTLVDGVSQLWSVWNTEWPAGALLSCCVQEMVYVTGQLVTQLSNNTILQVIEVLLSLTNSEDKMKIAAAHFLQQCRAVRLAPCAKQPFILKKIPQLFRIVLKANHPLIHHCGLEAFTKFAETTPHETMLPECLDSQAIQDTVVAFLNKVPHCQAQFSEVEYLKSQCVTKISQEDGDKQPTVEQKKDFLDDIESVTEPAAKRKRIQDNERGALADSMLSLTNCISQLESVCKDCHLSGSTREQLKDLHNRLGVILHDT